MKFKALFEVLQFQKSLTSNILELRFGNSSCTKVQYYSLISSIPQTDHK